MGVRLDSGDFRRAFKTSRAILDGAGLHDAKVMASGDLDEYRIRDLVAAGAPIDSFGVGTELATSADAPYMGAIYKMAELEGTVYGEAERRESLAARRQTILPLPRSRCSRPGGRGLSAGRGGVAPSGDCGEGNGLGTRRIRPRFAVTLRNR